MNKRTYVWIAIILLVAVIVFTIMERNDIVNAYEEVLKAEATLRSTNDLSEELTQLFENLGNYEEIKASGQFANLIEDLANSKLTATIACNAYEDAVMRYNKNINMFPGIVFAKLFGYNEVRSDANMEQQENASTVVVADPSNSKAEQQVTDITQVSSGSASNNMEQKVVDSTQVATTEGEVQSNNSSMRDNYFVQDNAGVIEDSAIIKLLVLFLFMIFWVAYLLFIYRLYK